MNSLVRTGQGEPNNLGSLFQVGISKDSNVWLMGDCVLRAESKICSVASSESFDRISRK